jgi:hypothetical protein
MILKRSARDGAFLISALCIATLAACGAGDNDNPGGPSGRSTGNGGSTSGGSGSPGAGSGTAGTASPAAGTANTAGNGGSSSVAGASTGGGGAAGSGGAGGGSGGASVKGCASADILCLTFEDIAAGSMPMAAPFQMYNCAGQSTSTDLLVEEGKGKGGGKALTSKKTMNGGCNLLADLGEHAELWVTADVMFSAGVPVDTVHELTPFEVTKSATDDPGIRPGIRADSSCNSWPGAELNITGGGERTGCTAFKFETEKWYCLEVQIKNQAAAVEGDLHIDGTKQPFHIHQDAVQTVVNMDWTGARMLRLGARAYSAEVNSPTYVDNLSASTTRVGCGP